MNHKGLKWPLKMWHHYCCKWRITQDSNGLSKCSTIIADCYESHRIEMASQNVAQFLAIVENYTGLKWLLKMWHNYYWQLWILQKWNGISKCDTITADSVEPHKTAVVSQYVAQSLLTVVNYTSHKWSSEHLNRIIMHEGICVTHNNICRFIYLWFICNSCLIDWNTPVITYLPITTWKYIHDFS